MTAKWAIVKGLFEYEKTQFVVMLSKLTDIVVYPKYRGINTFKEIRFKEKIQRKDKGNKI